LINSHKKYKVTPCSFNGTIVSISEFNATLSYNKVQLIFSFTFDNSVPLRDVKTIDRYLYKRFHLQKTKVHLRYHTQLDTRLRFGGVKGPAHLAGHPNLRPNGQ